MGFLSILSSILSFISTTMSLGWKLVKTVGGWVAGAGLRKKYKEDSDAVKDGNVDEINKIIRRGQS